MRTLDRFKPGDPLSASRFNALREALAPGGLAFGSGLDLAGDALRRARRSPITAKLSGSTSPYSWVQRIETAPGTWSDGPLSGTSNAYEVNGVAGLADAHARLFPDPTGGWRFQSIRAGSGGGGDPITCICWHDGDRPATLSWSADYTALDGAGSPVLLGTKSGTLTYTTALSYPKAGGGTCSILNGGSPVAGWIGPWSDYCYLPGAGTSITGYDRPQCRDNSTCSSGSGDRCRYLWVACSSILGPSGGGNLGWSETFVNTFTGVASCVDNIMPTSGTNPVTTTCSPFSMHRDGFMSFFGVDVDMTITE